MTQRGSIQKAMCGTAAYGAMLAVLATGAALPAGATTNTNFQDSFAPRISRTTSAAPRRWLIDEGVSDVGLSRNDRTTQDIPIASYEAIIVARPITSMERAIGELRSYGMLGANWDDDGAVAPERASISLAVAFIHSLPNGVFLPDTILHPDSGRAGLFWEADNLIADLEFYPDGRVTYFIKRSELNKHRGVVVYNGKALPPPFLSLLS